MVGRSNKVLITTAFMKIALTEPLLAFVKNYKHLAMSPKMRFAIYDPFNSGFKPQFMRFLDRKTKERIGKI